MPLYWLRHRSHVASVTFGFLHTCTSEFPHARQSDRLPQIAHDLLRGVMSALRAFLPAHLDNLSPNPTRPISGIQVNYWAMAMRESVASSLDKAAS